MAGWLFSITVWMLLSAAIYFTGHLQQLKVSQNYQTFTQAMLGVAGQTATSNSCHQRQQLASLVQDAGRGFSTSLINNNSNQIDVSMQERGSLLPYLYCSDHSKALLLPNDERASILHDLGVHAELLYTVSSQMSNIGFGKKAFIPFIEGLPADYSLHKTVSVLAHDGSSATPAQIVHRLEASEKTWGGVVLPSRQGFWQYQHNIESSDGVWRGQDDTQWLLPWSAHSPSNHLITVP